MKAYIARCPIGIFAFAEDGALIAFKAAETVDEAVHLVKGSSNPLEKGLSGYDLLEDDSAYRIFRRNFRSFAGQAGFEDEKLAHFLNEFGIKYSTSFLSMAVTRDKLLIQASNALEDVKRTINLYNERLWEWFSLHYPEANRKTLVEMAAEYGKREKFPSFSRSLGIELTDSDEKILRSYAILIVKTAEEKKKLEKYIAETAKELMPSFSSLIDPLLAVRFLSLAGSLEKLARMPASTIQLLGAEKSLFRHLKQQGKSPKYGLLFQDGRIQSAQEEKRGKIARIISSKLMLAARIDFYSCRLEEKLKKDMEKELEKI